MWSVKMSLCPNSKSRRTWIWIPPILKLGGCSSDGVLSVTLRPSLLPLGRRVDERQSRYGSGGKEKNTNCNNGIWSCATQLLAFLFVWRRSLQEDAAARPENGRLLHHLGQVKSCRQITYIKSVVLRPVAVWGEDRSHGTEPFLRSW